jgi:hypothetical protein
MSTARRAALEFLGSEWNRSVWRRWLSNIFVPPVEPPTPPVEPPVAAAVDRSNTAPASATSACFEREPEQEPQGAGSRDARRPDVRARFEALSERLTGIEDSLETLLRRAAQRDKSERRADSEAADAMASFAELAERQAAALEGLLGGVARLEHGLSRVERAVSERDRGRHDSFFPSAMSSEPPPSRPPLGAERLDSGTIPRGRSSGSQRPAEGDESDAGGASSIHGHLSELSLSTVLAMLELERRTGRLRVATDDGLLASFELLDGSVTHCRLSENDADPLHALRTALRWKNGRFWFRQQAPETKSYAPRSIGSLLLEATQQNDESFAGVGTD